MSISIEEIAGRPDSLFTQEIWRPGKFAAVEILWVANESPRCRSAISDSIRLTRESALTELTSIREWWNTVESLWVEGRCVLVVHDGEMTDDEINLWIDLNLVVPWFREVLGDQNLSLDEIKLMTEWHQISR